MSASLQIQGLLLRYSRSSLFRKSLAEKPAVDRVDLSVAPGEVLGIIGESGSGKTSLVRAALGLIPFQEGRVEVLGQELSALSPKALREARRHFQILFQDPAAMLNPGMTVREHLLESATLHRSGDPHSIVEDMAHRVGLSHRLDALPKQLSGGEKRRVGLARVLIPEPTLLVADEPTAGLDAALKADLIDAIVAHRDSERTVVLISHDLPMVAYACDRIVVMLEGEIVERFPSAELGKRDHHPYTQQLLRAAGLLVGADGRECAREKE